MAKSKGKKPAKTDEPDYTKPLENAKHERFCQEYVKQLNATDSYQTAYPKSSRKTAEVNGCVLLRNTKAACRLVCLQNKLSKSTGVSTEKLLDEFKKIAFGRVTKTLTNNHKINSLENIGKHIGFYGKDN